MPRQIVHSQVRACYHGYTRYELGTALSFVWPFSFLRWQRTGVFASKINRKTKKGNTPKLPAQHKGWTAAVHYLLHWAENRISPNLQKRRTINPTEVKPFCLCRRCSPPRDPVLWADGARFLRASSRPPAPRRLGRRSLSSSRRWRRCCATSVRGTCVCSPSVRAGITAALVRTTWLSPPDAPTGTSATSPRLYSTRHAPLTPATPPLVE